MSPLPNSSHGITESAASSPPSATTPPTLQTPSHPAMNANPAFSAQLQRLLIEMLPFRDAQQFHEWLAGPYVSGAWDEFRKEYLNGTGPEPPEEPDKAATCQVVRTVLHSSDPKYRLMRPDKTGWTAQDHTVRFMVSVVWDNFFSGLWSVRDYRVRPDHYVNVVYEVLGFLRAWWWLEEVQARAKQGQNRPDDAGPVHDAEELYDENLYDDGHANDSEPDDDDEPDDDETHDPNVGEPYANLTDGSDASEAEQDLLDTGSSWSGAVGCPSVGSGSVGSLTFRSRGGSPEVFDQNEFSGQW
jgi:hypothetical protein